MEYKDLEEKYEELVGVLPKYIKSFAMDAVVAIVAIAYVFYQMVTLEPTELNPLVLIAGAIVGIICGVVIKQALGENGFSRGYNSKIWLEEESKYNDYCNDALPFMDKTDNFNQCEEIEKKRKYRRQHLQEIRLKYDNWFDKNGDYIGTDEMFNKLDKKQKKVLKKCIKVKIYPLNLFSQYTISTDQDSRPEITDNKKRTKNITTNTVSAVLIAVIGVYFVPFFKSWSWANFITATMQVALWVLFGIIQLYTNFNFVVQDKVALFRRKKELITKFISGCKKGLYDKSPYELEDGNEESKEEITEVTILNNNEPVLDYQI